MEFSEVRAEQFKTSPQMCTEMKACVLRKAQLLLSAEAELISDAVSKARKVIFQSFMS